jgi:glycosyltransferase involved in cell wall biosynthesis
VPLRFYRSLASPAAVPALLSSLRRGWRAVGEADRVWLLGPHPLIVFLAAFALLRRKRLVLGVRQDFPAYMRSRRPHSRFARLAADLLEGFFRRLARRCPTVVVGPQLAANYHDAAELLETRVSLIGEDEIVEVEAAMAKDYSGALTILSVGRLDNEKNPLMLVEVLERLVDRGGDWRLEICGDGPLAGEVEQALERGGLRERAELAGYVRIDDGLHQRYRDAHVLLHSSWTEGFPQVLLEAFAAGLPVVASDVGGIRAAVGERLRLIEPGDAGGAVEAIEEICADPETRRELVERGHLYALDHTLDRESAAVAAFIEG